MVEQSNNIDYPSAWVARFAGLIPDGEVLDLACGKGRHARLLAMAGHAVLAVDRDDDALACASGFGISTHKTNLEASSDSGGVNWPFESERFSGIVVTNYLHRPLFPGILASLATGGVLIYETFAVGNERFGKPSNPDFLLEPGELLRMTGSAAAHPMRIVAYEDGYVELPKPAMVQRICAVKEAAVMVREKLELN